MDRQEIHGFMLNIVKPAWVFGTHFYLCCAICLWDHWYFLVLNKSENSHNERVFGVFSFWLKNLVLYFFLLGFIFCSMVLGKPSQKKNILSFGHCPNNNPLHPLASIFRQTFTFLRWENVVFLHCLKLNENDNFGCRNWNSSSTDENIWPCFLGHLTLPPCPRSRYLELGHMCGVTQHAHPEYAICMVIIWKMFI